MPRAAETGSSLASPLASGPALETPLAPRAIGAVNWRGLWTLYIKEVRRFLNVFSQTVLAPIVTTLLFYAIFTFALGRRSTYDGEISFAVFLVPGLVMMSMLQNAFANTSSSILIAKIQGNIVDVLMPPLSPTELTLGVVLGGVSRGLLVGAVVCLTMSAFVSLPLSHPDIALYFALNASLMLSLLGMLGGIWADKFDQMAAVTNFVITPLSFLSGTFYSIERLPENWALLAYANPFFYLIDGFRYGLVGVSDASVLLGGLIVLAINVALFALVHRMIATGYRLKA